MEPGPRRSKEAGRFDDEETSGREFDRAFTALEPRLRASFDVVVYCSGFGCEASHLVARRLKERGIPAVVLSEGWPAWQEAGYPMAA